MEKAVKHWRGLVIQKCVIQIRFVRAWADFTSQNPHVTSKYIADLLDQIEHLNTLIDKEEPFDINRRLYGSGAAMCNNDSSRHIR